MATLKHEVHEITGEGMSDDGYSVMFKATREGQEWQVDVWSSCDDRAKPDLDRSIEAILLRYSLGTTIVVDYFDEWGEPR